MKRIITTLNKTNQNYVFSPVAVYYALIILAQITDGKTQEEITKALGLNKNELLDKSQNLYNSLNINKNNGRIMLNSSLWLNDKHQINQDITNRVAKDNNCAIRQGKMGTRIFDREIHDWINTYTHGLLKDKVENIKTDVMTIMELISTIYLKGSWIDNFYEYETNKRKFNITKDDEVKCDFMHQWIRDDLYIGDHFKALSKRLNGVGKMIFILPNEGLTPNDLKMI